MGERIDGNRDFERVAARSGRRHRARRKCLWRARPVRGLFASLRSALGAAACALVLGLASPQAAEPAAKPSRIVSLNLCTDELVLRLAERERVASISWLSQDPRNANLAELARTIPANHGLAEEVLSYKPDLIIAGTYTNRGTVAMLKSAGLPVSEFGVPNTLAEMRGQIREMAALLGESERGEALIAAIDQRLAALAARRIPHRAGAIVLQPNGFTVSRGSLIDEILTLAGLTNRAADLGIDSYGQVALEAVALSQTELLILDTEPGGPPSLADAILHHPVLARLGDRVRLIALPARLWTCPGPAVLDAIELLAEAAARRGARP